MQQKEQGCKGEKSFQGLHLTWNNYHVLVYHLIFCIICNQFYDLNVICFCKRPFIVTLSTSLNLPP
jgi:hypothetical protein